MSGYQFLKDETGAVSVDWVTIAAACCALGFFASQSTSAAIGSLSGDITVALEEDDPSRNYFDEIQNGVYMATYEPFSTAYSASSGDAGTWAEQAYATYNAFMNSTLVDYYESYYETAVTSDNGDNVAQAIDHLYVLEYVLESRGIRPPADNLSSQDLRQANG